MTENERMLYNYRLANTRQSRKMNEVHVQCMGTLPNLLLSTASRNWEQSEFKGSYNTNIAANCPDSGGTVSFFFCQASVPLMSLL
jgi:hypothetical protein